MLAPISGGITMIGRRRFWQFFAAAAIVPATSKIAMSQSYPARPIRLE